MTRPPDEGALPLLRRSAADSAIAYGGPRAAEPYFWSNVHRILQAGAKRVCDVGGGARPILSLKVIEELGLDYVIADISQDELDKAPSSYQTFQANILDRQDVGRLIERHGPFDLVLSRWTAEHMPDGKAFHEQVFSMLRPGGRALHLMPTLYTPPFLINRLAGARLSRTLLFAAFPKRRGKFPAFYSWCRGPSSRQLRRLRGLGYSIEQYIGFFGHGMYARIKPLHLAQKLLTRALLRRPVPSMTSFALMVLRRPDN